jgi:hypothetical protein
MKFIDTVTGAKIEANNDFVIEQYKKYPERYKEEKTPAKKAEEKK